MARSETVAHRRQGTVEARRAIHRDAVEILTTEFDRPIRIEEVARRVATSSRHLQRVFAEADGLGFREYLRQIRMSRAAELLATSDLPVAEVARHVGYGDPGQFSKTYKRAFGVSPSQTRTRRRAPREAGASPHPPSADQSSHEYAAEEGRRGHSGSPATAGCLTADPRTDPIRTVMV
jgi:transcriptional regulator GlxA family with amidase domain